jgi:hypothetical protein
MPEDAELAAAATVTAPEDAAVEDADAPPQTH